MSSDSDSKSHQTHVTCVVLEYNFYFCFRNFFVLLFFFFQAEDGIRDLTVTGVQTCALPICHRAERQWRNKQRDPHYRRCHAYWRHWLDQRHFRGCRRDHPRQPTHHRFSQWHRSEERRVGKECRSRWSPYHEKKKKKEKYQEK